MSWLKDRVKNVLMWWVTSLIAFSRFRWTLCRVGCICGLSSGVSFQLLRKINMLELETGVQIIKRDIEDLKSIHGRFGCCGENRVSNGINRMLFMRRIGLDKKRQVYELEKQIESRRSELLDKIDNLHSRITTNTKR